MTEAEARAAIVRVHRALAERGMNTGSTGNVSLRFPPFMLVTPTAIAAEALAAERIVAVAPDGAASGGVPSSEWPMHAAIYRAAPEAGCVVHTHSDAATALACLGEGLPAFHYMIAAFGGGDVRCAPYVTFGTPALAAAATAAIAGRRACLLANHGMIVHGRDPEQALLLAVQLETLCRQYLLARAAGAPRLLTPSELDAALARFADYAAGRG